MSTWFYWNFVIDHYCIIGCCRFPAQIKSPLPRSLSSTSHTPSYHFIFLSRLYCFPSCRLVSVFFSPCSTFVSRVISHPRHVLVPPTQCYSAVESHAALAPPYAAPPTVSLFTSAFTVWLGITTITQKTSSRSCWQPTQRRTWSEFFRHLRMSKSYFSGWIRSCKLTDLKAEILVRLQLVTGFHRDVKGNAANCQKF